MPRQPSGEYILPAGQPVETQTVISASVHNALANDAAAALTDSLSRTGLGGMLVPFRVPDGSVTLPSYSFTSATDSGIFYEPSQKWVQISVSGILGVTIKAGSVESAHRFVAPQYVGLNQGVATPSSSDHAFQAGLTTEENVRIGSDGLQAVNNGFVADLHLNKAGGAVLINNEPILTDVYEKSEYISASNGVDDAGKPIVLNTSGKVDPSMLDLSSLTYVGSFTPAAGSEYPDMTGHEVGSYWSITGLGAGIGYDFVDVGGDLVGETIYDGDYMIYGAEGWSIIVGRVDPTAYYPLDGTFAITAPFAAGGHQLKNLGDGVDDSDALTVGQSESLNYLPVSGKAADSDLLDGIEAAGFLLVDGIAANSQLLEGNSASDFLPVDGKAVDSELLDGIDSTGFALAGHIHDDRYYREDEYVDVSTGTDDAAKPIILNGDGKIDSSMVEVISLKYIGAFTPTSGIEYPDTTGVEVGSYWSVNGLGVGVSYTFLTGDLVGQSVEDGDFMVWGTAGWGIITGKIDPTIYYQLDGSVAITGNFAGGGFIFTNAANAIADTDLIPLGQANSRYLAATGKAADSSLLDGLPSSAFLLATGKAADSNLLDGVEGDGYLLVDGVAVNSLLLDGQAASAFLPVGGVAADSLLLGGQPSSAFLAVTGTAANSSLLDGNAASHFATAAALSGYLPLTGGDLTGALTSTGDITAFSDIKLKKNRRIISDALAKVSKINGYTFERIDLEDGKRYTGVIAQEVREVLPEVIRESADGTLSVAYGNMVGLLIEAIKDLMAEVDDLKGKIK